ncbi:MAG: hypothetical protein JO069_03105 [Verrucomicrobia bacterium]|nr:hypothetical protein [Verrucomicrobiota bacterium]
MKFSSSTLRKAAELQEQIERLENDLRQLLDTDNAGGTAGGIGTATQREEGAQSATRGRRGSRAAAATPSSNGRGRGRRSTSPSGPLAPAVVKVLKSRGTPMSVAEILEGLNSSGYKFTSPEPKKNLFARIYRLKGVRQVGPGKFTAD